MKRFISLLSFFFVLSNGYSQAIKHAQNDTSAIRSINYQNTGGEMVSSFDLTINSELFTYRYAQKIKQKKIDIKYWSQLVKSINLDDFDTAPNGKPVAALDGLDKIITIRTAKGEHKLLLDYTKLKTGKYAKIMPFLQLLKLKLNQIGWREEIVN